MSRWIIVFNTALLVLGWIPNGKAEESSTAEYAADERPSQPASDQPNFDPATLITNADRIAYRLVGYPEVGGEYRISPDGTVSLPVVGRFSVKGLDVAGLERLLSERVKELTGRPAYPTIEIARYRPVHVTGFVNAPGAPEWQPNLTILQAVAISGGLYRTAESPDISARYNRAVDDQKRALATLARVQAEHDGADDINIPESLVALAGRSDAESLVGAERTLFRSRKATLENQLTALEQGKALAQQELAGLQKQSEHINQQLELRRGLSNKIRALLEKGLASEDRAVQEAIQVSDLEERLTNISVAVARVRETLAGLNRDMASLRRTRETESVSDMIRLQRELAQGKFEIEAASAELQQNTTEGRQLESIVRYRIMRGKGESVQSLEGSEGSLLYPGDVLVVSRELR